MNNYLLYSDKEYFLTHKENSLFSTKNICLMLAFYYSIDYLKVKINDIYHKSIETLDLTFENHITNSKTKINSSTILNNKEEIHANTPTDLGGSINYFFVCVNLPAASRSLFYLFLFI
jgi:hypothetical protein